MQGVTLQCSLTLYNTCAHQLGLMSIASIALCPRSSTYQTVGQLLLLLLLLRLLVELLLDTRLKPFVGRRIETCAEYAAKMATERDMYSAEIVAGIDSISAAEAVKKTILMGLHTPVQTTMAAVWTSTQYSCALSPAIVTDSTVHGIIGPQEVA